MLCVKSQLVLIQTVKNHKNVQINIVSVLSLRLVSSRPVIILKTGKTQHSFSINF